MQFPGTKSRTRRDEDAEGASLSDAQARSSGLLGSLGSIVGPVGPAVWTRLRGATFARALHYRDYRLVWTGALVSNIGMWMQNVARGVLVYELSPEGAKKLWLGIDGFVLGLCAVALLPFGGVLADRLARRWLLVGVNLAGAVVAAVLAVLYAVGLLEVWHIVVSSALTGALQGVMIPANQSLMPSLVDHDDLPNAIALNSIQFNTSRIVGPALGGLVLWYWGAAWSFGINAISFAAVVFALLAMHNPPPVPSDEQHETMLQSLRGGVGYIRSRPDLVVMLSLIMITGFFVGPVITMLPALVSEVYGQPSAYYARLLSFFGVGALTGAMLFAARSKRRPAPWRSFIILMGLGLCVYGFGWRGPSGWAPAMALLSGLGFTGVMIRLFTALMQSTPDSVRGRMSSFQVLAFRTGMPVGSLLAGMIAQAFGVDIAFFVFGWTLIAVVAVLWWYVRRRGVIHTPVDSQDA